MSRQVVVIVVILSGIIFSSTLAGKRIGRIQGGIEANIEDFPWLTSVRKGGSHLCGGSIINAKNILTVAHCMYKVPPEVVDVHVGSKFRTGGGQVIAAKLITCHGLYDYKTSDYDIAIVRLVAKIAFSNSAKPVPLAKKTFQVNPGDYAYTAGWGSLNPRKKVHPDVLQSLRVMVIDKKLCEFLLSVKLTERMLCAGEPHPDKITCAGDSGGPLTINGTLVGVVAYGPKCGRPDLYTKVSTVRSWIEKNMKK